MLAEPGNELVRRHGGEAFAQDFGGSDSSERFEPHADNFNLANGDNLLAPAQALRLLNRVQLLACFYVMPA